MGETQELNSNRRALGFKSKGTGRESSLLLNFFHRLKHLYDGESNQIAVLGFAGKNWIETECKSRQVHPALQKFKTKSTNMGAHLNSMTTS
jgi:hypothetical protein